MRSRLGVCLATAVLLAACASPDVPGDIPCTTDNQCPSGQVCSRGLCRQPGFDAGPLPDSGIAADSGVIVPDSGPPADAGVPDAGFPDAGTTGPDGGVPFGSPCTMNNNCQSGICIQTSEGGVCSKLCSQDCPADWGCRLVNLTPVCVPPELTLCATCNDDSDCGGSYKCTSYSGAKVCLLECTMASQCGAGQTCLATTSADGGPAVDDGGVAVDGGAGGRCVPTTDAKHCGACGLVCAGEGTTCCANRCVRLLEDEASCGTTCANAVACAGGQQCCNGSCTDVQSSDSHCGACVGEGGQACSGTDQKCCGGSCVSIRDNDLHCGSCDPCTGGTSCCGLSCANLGSDPGNCQTCGVSCSPTQACCGSDACTTVTSNDKHCGACGNDCGVTIGPAGNCCGTTCRNKLVDKDACGDNCTVCSGTEPACCSGSCVDLDNDPTHCGACTGAGTTCTASQTCCGGSCKNLATDPTFCGTNCGNAVSCNGGTCCSGACKDTTGDPANCGACGKVCGVTAGTMLDNVSEYTCSGSACGIKTCASGFHNLDGTTSNGCECASDSDEPTPFNVNTFNVGRNLGTRNDCDFSDEIIKNLAPSSDTEDFYRFHMDSDVFCNFNISVTLSVPQGTNYDLYFYKWNGSSWSLLKSSTNSGDTAELVECGGCDIICDGCGCNGCSTDGDYGVRVVRAAGAATVCGTYSLTITDD